MSRLVGAEFPAWVGSRSRLSLLLDDLAWFGRTPESCGAVRFDGVDDLPSALGAMYVLEGSTLGSQILMRHFERTLGVTASSGGAFFNGYGQETGSMWREFCAALEGYAARTGTHDRIVDGARAMFQVAERQLCGVAA